MSLREKGGIPDNSIGPSELFTQRRSGDREFVVGATIGSGMMAKAAERGGADFLIALNSARLRMMGASSSTAKLPLRDNNMLVSTFAREEILPQVTIPVFFGAAAYDPRSDMSRLAKSIADWGFSGVTNSRSVARYHGPFRQAIERAGLGIARECELFAQAKSYGLSTLAFVHSLRDAETFADVGVDAFCIQFAWSAGEFDKNPGPARLEEAMELARAIISRIRPARSQISCLVSGAPVIEPEEMLAVCDFAKADGYIGGSSVDRLPTEGSVENRMANFKNVAALRRQAEQVKNRVDKTSRRFGLVTESAPMRDISRHIDLLAASPLPVLITGEAGTGKTFLSQTLHEHGPRASRPLTAINCEIEPETLAARLFGSLPHPFNDHSRRRIGWFEQLCGSTLVLDGVEAINRNLQIDLAEAIETGRFRNIGSADNQLLDVRLIFTTRHPGIELLKSGLVEEALYLVLKPQEVSLPPMKDRLEDLPVLAQQIVSAMGGKGRQPVKDIDHAVIRKLAEREWPGNVRELMSVLAQAISHCRSDTITIREIMLAATAGTQEMPKGTDERSWILEALRKHRYRKGETAASLGICRKTLYLKMKKLGVDIGS